MSAAGGDDERAPEFEPAHGLDDGEPARSRGQRDEGEDHDEALEDEESHQAKAPWHFKFFVVASVVYLGYRAYQGISWLSHHL